MISFTKLSEIFSKISDDHKIVINLDDLKKSFPELSSLSNKHSNNLNVTRCLALMSKGERCTRKPKCMKQGLCGIHLNMLEKNGNLPNGKFNEDINNGASGQGSSDLVLDSNLKNKLEKGNNSSKSFKGNKKNKTKIDKDVETEDSDAEEDNYTETNLDKKKLDKETLNKKPINRKTPMEKTLDSSDSENSDDKMSENDVTEDEVIFKLKEEIDNAIKVIVGESNYDKCKTFTKKVEGILATKLDKKYLDNSTLLRQLIKSGLETEFNSYDSKLKESIEEYKENSSSSEEEIECIKFKVNDKTYLLDENTSIVYNIESPHSKVGILKNDVIVELD